MRRIAIAVLAVSLLAACTQGPPTPPEDQTPDPDPLTVTLRDYYATDGTRTLVLEDIIANRAATLDVEATCYLNTPPSFSLAIYRGRIQVETQGSNRYLSLSGTIAVPEATSISCQSIIGETNSKERVTIRIR